MNNCHNNRNYNSGADSHNIMICMYHTFLRQNVTAAALKYVQEHWKEVSNVFAELDIR